MTNKIVYKERYALPKYYIYQNAIIYVVKSAGRNGYLVNLNALNVDIGSETIKFFLYENLFNKGRDIYNYKSILNEKKYESIYYFKSQFI